MLSTSATDELPGTRWRREAYRCLKPDPICPPEARSDLALRRKRVSATDHLAVSLTELYNLGVTAIV